MKAARYYGAEDVRIEEVPLPGPPGPDEVLVHVQMAALCGTDASQYTHATMIPVDHPHSVSAKQAPLVLGHELVGTIVELGSAVTDLRMGQRVVPGSGWWCGNCDLCQAGRSNICQHAYLYGIHADGGLAEFARFPAKMCVPVPAGCRNEAAAMAQACAVALHALDRAMIEPGQTVAIFGIGSIGSLLLAAGSAFWENRVAGPPSVIAVDIDPARLATAAALGVTLRVDASTCDPALVLQQITGGQGVDVAIEATGDPVSIAHALTAIKRGGKLLQVGIPTGLVSLPLGDLVLAEKEILTTNGQICQMDLPNALDLLTFTDLAERIRYQVIMLEEVVERGLQPLAEHRASAKILVRIPEYEHE
jgi:(R,R)-butanediol dehydrogenase / meso-butanediol dehydrogenase / diacetyl reductase